MDTNVKGPAGNGYSAAKSWILSSRNQNPNFASLQPSVKTHATTNVMRVKGGRGQYSRSDSVESTGLQLQQAILPILPGHPEVVHGASDYHEFVAIQGEIAFSVSLTCSAKAYSSVLQAGRGQMGPAEPASEGREKRGARRLLQTSGAVRRLLAGHAELLVPLVFPRKRVEAPHSLCTRTWQET